MQAKRVQINIGPCSNVWEKNIIFLGITFLLSTKKIKACKFEKTCKLWQNFELTVHLSACLLNSNAKPIWCINDFICSPNTCILPLAQLWMENVVAEWSSSYRECNLASIARTHDHLPPVDMISVDIWVDKSKGKYEACHSITMLICWVSLSFGCITLFSSCRQLCGTVRTSEVWLQ